MSPAATSTPSWTYGYRTTRNCSPKVENDVERLEPWYEGQTSFGLAVPTYMKGVNSIADLNQSGAERIIGIEPGAMITTKIDEHVIPDYNLTLEHEPSSTAAMLAEVERLYKDKEPFVFPPVVPESDVW